jgi:hypothetical protein
MPSAVRRVILCSFLHRAADVVGENFYFLVKENVALVDVRARLRVFLWRDF